VSQSFENLCMTSKRLGEMFEADLQKRAMEIFPWCQWGAERMVKRAQTWERGQYVKQHVTACRLFY
jgi:hypothetical protein